MAEDKILFSKSARYLRNLRNTNRKKLARDFAVAVLLAFSALVCQYYFNLFANRNSSFFFLYIAVALSALSGGFFGGIVTTLLGAAGADYLFLRPYQELSLQRLSMDNIILLIVFALGGFIISFAVEQAANNKELRFYKKREKELMALVAQQELDLAQAQVQVKARDEFLSIASHELKTPLTSMLLQIQSILHSIQHVSLAQFSVQNLMSKLQNAEAQTVRLSKMINDLLNVSLITTGRFTLEKENFDLSQLVQSVVDGFSERLQKDNIKVHLQLDEKSWEIGIGFE